jgi:hypothetical protein
VSETSLAAVLDTRAPPEACQELIELAKKAGTGDNVTVIVAEFQCAPVVDPIIGLGSPMANSRGVQHTETVRFRHSPDQAPFEETRDLWITPSKCVTCGVTVRPEDYWGRYPACIELWLDTGTERISRFLVGSGGDQVNWPKNLTANSVDMIAGDSEIALQVAELTIIASVRDVSFATAQKGQFRQVTIDFEFTFDPVLADARPS